MRIAGLFVLIAMPAAAFAQAPADPPHAAKPSSDDTIDPSQVPIDEPPPAPPYPRSFVDRPVVLPRGIREISIGSNIGRDSFRNYRVDYGGAGAGLELGFDRFDVDVGVDLNILEDDNWPIPVDAPLFRRVVVGASWLLPAETYVGVQGVIGNVASDRQRYSPSLFVGHKFRTSEGSAIFVHGGVDYNYGNEVGSGDDRYVTHRFGAYAGGTARVQATSIVALQISGSITQYRYVDKYHPNSDWSRGLSAGAGILVSATRTIDVWPYVSISTFEKVESVGAGLSVSLRSR